VEKPVYVIMGNCKMSGIKVFVFAIIEIEGW